jgi:hypothetical protein
MNDTRTSLTPIGREGFRWQQTLRDGALLLQEQEPEALDRSWNLQRCLSSANDHTPDSKSCVLTLKTVTPSAR